MALQNVEANITLDLYNHDTTPATVKAIQLDSQTRYVAAMLQSMGAEYGLDSNATVQLIVIRPDKVGVQITGTTFTYGDEGAQFLGPYAELTQVALAVNGKMRGQFKITSGDQILRTEIFTISNGEALDASTDEWADEYDGYNLEEMATSIETNTADIATLEADVSQIKEDFTDIVNSAYVTDSASGGVAHFVDGADDVPMKSVKVNIAPVQSGSGDPSPSNVRAISGWSSVKVTRNGRNFCKCIVKTIKQNKNGLTATPNGDGSITINGTCTATLVLYFNLATEGGDGIDTGQGNRMKNLPNGTYRFGALPSGVRLQIYGSDVPNATSADAHFISDSTRGTFIITDAYRYNWVRMSVSVNTVLDNATVYPALYLASDTDEAHEPYQGDTYDIPLASAGTVYGGALDVVSGVLTVTHGYIASYSGQELPSAWISDRDVYAEGTRPTTGAQVVYQLATPITYNLTPTEVKSLLGVNNVWSDAGDVDVEYRADTKLYIKRLTDSDTDMIADANITSGQYFMVGNDLYKATVNIASGAQIVVGTNATKVSLSEALNQIKEA